jgi:hypothetical protein
LAGHENLMSIKGILQVSAAVLLSIIGNIEDFREPGKLAAYLGLVPGSKTPKKRNGLDISPGKATSWRERCWCTARSWPRNTVPTCSSSISVFNAVRAIWKWQARSDENGPDQMSHELNWQSGFQYAGEMFRNGTCISDVPFWEVWPAY